MSPSHLHFFYQELYILFQSAYFKMGSLSLCLLFQVLYISDINPLSVAQLEKIINQAVNSISGDLLVGYWSYLPCDCGHNVADCL